MSTVDLKDAEQRFAELVAKAAQGEVVVIAQGDQPLVKMTAWQSPKIQRQFGSAKGLIEMADDFDEPLDDFREYM